MSLGGKYAFVTVMSLVLPMCIVSEWVCEWEGGGLFVMGSCVFCAWCWCYVLCGCMKGASPVRFVLSLFYMCAIQMNPVLCVWLHLIVVCFLFICL